MAEVTQLLDRDHREAERLFALLRMSDPADRGYLVALLGSLLRLHMDIEEQIVFPAITRHTPGGGEMVTEAVLVHSQGRAALALVEQLSPDEAGFEEALADLEQTVSRSVQKEDGEVFPVFRHSVDVAVLELLALEVEQARRSAGRQ